MQFKTTIGQDSHKFSDDKSKPLMLGGYLVKGHNGFDANSDGDVILHAITNAISALSGYRVLGEKADKLCRQGQTDSKIYLQLALSKLNDWKISHVAISLEGATPHLAPHIDSIRSRLAEILAINISDIGITATSGEKLTSFGQGLGMQAIAIISFFNN